MQSLRNAAFLARLVLAWFVLSLGVAVAAPAVNPQSIELICSAAGQVKVLVTTDDGVKELTASQAMECPMCLPVAAPAPVETAFQALPQPLGRSVQPIPSARIAALTAAPLPARGPPSLLSI